MANEKDIYSVKTIREKKYNTLDLGPRFNDLFGRPEAKTVAMFYGESGSGKSVLALQFAEYYANHIGKTLYNSHEEGVNQTLQDRIVEFNINSPKLYFGKNLKFERMMEKIKSNHYRAVFIDSVQYMQFTAAQLKELRKTFSKRSIFLVLVSFGKTLGNPTRAEELLHASDIKCFFKQGQLTVTSRYLARPKQFTLFTPKSIARQGGLFSDEN